MTRTIAEARAALRAARTPSTRRIAREWLAAAWADCIRLETGEPCTTADLLAAVSQLGDEMGVPPELMN
jgi:hypothetical protein